MPLRCIFVDLNSLFTFRGRTPNFRACPTSSPSAAALLSVSDKTGLAEFARALHEEFKVELISTGGTAKFLRDSACPSPTSPRSPASPR